MIQYYEPKTGKFIGEIIETEISELSGIRQNAKESFVDWSRFSIQERMMYLRQIKQYIVNHFHELSQEVANLTGKPVFEGAYAEIYSVLELLKYYEKNGEKFLKDEKISISPLMGFKKGYIRYKPMGCILIISPWNYPFNLTMIPLISALLAGNVAIVKPSSKTGWIGVILERIFEAVNLPEHVVQFVYSTQSNEIGKSLIELQPDKIFFTGSTSTGKKIIQMAAEYVIPVEAEMGGDDALIVLEDANLERAASAAVWGAFLHSGQTCLSVERVYVHEKVYDHFISLLKEKIGELWQGDEPYADLGAMTSLEQVQIVKAQVDEAIAQGAKYYSKGEFTGDSLYVSPILLTEVNHQMNIMKEEIFGPVLPVMKIHSEDEAVKLANDSKFGLGLSIFTANLPKAHELINQIRTGTAAINDTIIQVAIPQLPFGGTKESGSSRTRGKEGIRMFTDRVSIIEDTGIKNKEFQWFPYSSNKMKVIEKMILLFKKNR